jgi:hypothetical protein
MSTFRDLTGQRIGEWTVIRRAPSVLTPGGHYRTMWLCRCDCGAMHDVGAGALVRSDGDEGASRRCRACHDRRCAERGRALRSHRLPTGETIAQLAHRTGVPLDTVFVRYRRGWPIEKLGAPIAPRYAKRPQTRARMEATR